MGYEISDLKIVQDLQKISTKLRQIRDLQAINTMEIQKSLQKEEEEFKNILDERKVSLEGIGPKICNIIKNYNRLLICEEVHKEINVRLNKIRIILTDLLKDI